MSNNNNDPHIPVTALIWGVLGICPHCHQRRMFKGLYALHDRCPHCGLVFENLPGDFTGTAYINSFLTGLIAVVLGMIVVVATDIAVPVILIGFLPLILLIATALHQPIKGAWIAFMYYTHALVPPEM